MGRQRKALRDKHGHYFEKTHVTQLRLERLRWAAERRARSSKGNNGKDKS